MCALERGGADVVAVPIPLTPAARVVLSALPLTGCVLCSGAEVDALYEELDGPGWSAGARRWCIGKEAGRRAEERGWRMVHVLEGVTEGAAVVEWIAGQVGGG